MNIDQRGAWMYGGTLLLTRLLMAFIFFWHGLPKAVNLSMAMEKFVGFGLPGALGPVTGWAEVICATLLVLGFRHRAANLVLAVIITGAIVTVQAPAGFGAGLERDLLILAATLTLAAHGPGLFALDGRLARRRAVAPAAA